MAVAPQTRGQATGDFDGLLLIGPGRPGGATLGRVAQSQKHHD